MKLTQLIAASLITLSFGTSANTAALAAPVTVPQENGSPATGIPAECGTGANSTFLSTSGMPLVTALNNHASGTANSYAGLVVLAPNQAADPTNLSTLNPIFQQGNFTQTFNINNPGSQGNFSFQAYVAYSFVNKNGVTRYGVSSVPTAGIQQVNNHTLKGKSATFVIVSNTDLNGQRASLVNLTGGGTPGNQATNLTLLGIATVITNNSNTANAATASFNTFVLNSTNTNGNYPPVSGGTNVPVGKDVDQSANLNCNSFVPVGALQ